MVSVPRKKAAVKSSTRSKRSSQKLTISGEPASARAAKIAIASPEKNKPAAAAKKVSVKEVKGKKSEKVSILNNTKALEKTKVIAQRPVQTVAVPSPYRFPMIRRMELATISRIAGIFFVVAGGFFSLLNFQYINSGFVAPDEMQAAAVSGTIEPADALDATEQPVTQVLIDGSGTLKDIVHVAVMVANATHVQLIAEDTEAGLSVALGAATKADDTTWKYEWDTAKIPDGSYVIRAAIANNDGSYDQRSKTYEVKNAAVPEDLDGEEDTVDADATETEERDDTSASEAESTLTIGAAETELEPQIVFQTSAESPLSGFVTFTIETSPAEYIEIYAQPEDSLVPIYIGRAQRQHGNSWKYAWNTANTPNGAYDIYMRVKNAYGYSTSDHESIQVANDASRPLTALEEARLESYRSTKEVLFIESALPSVTDATATPASQTTPSNAVYIEPVTAFLDTLSEEAGEDGAETEAIAERLRAYRTELDVKLSAYKNALRIEDPDRKVQILGEMESLKHQLVTRLAENSEHSWASKHVDAYLSTITFALRDLTEKNERLIKERIGESVFLDTDKDSISDYDEVTEHGTDPFAADTDSDGHTDDTEIALGFDPRDSASEALKEYESANVSGIENAEMLAIESIATVKDDRDTEPTKMNKALISGRALPNSFVSVYIYSTQVVTTIKTDASGNWSYLFDKELEDGAHEAYVGMTDNTGRIVARSAAYAFVKTVEAFEPVRETVTIQTSQAAAPSFASMRGLTLIASLCVVALGLVLILLGMYATMRRHAEQNVVHP